jgi:hypothetical protein
MFPFLFLNDCRCEMVFGKAITETLLKDDFVPAVAIVASTAADKHVAPVHLTRCRLLMASHPMQMRRIYVTRAA